MILYSETYSDMAELQPVPDDTSELQPVPDDTSEPQPVPDDTSAPQPGRGDPNATVELAPPPYPQFSFSLALNFLKEGGSVARVGWNGKGLRVSAQFPTINSWMTLPYLYIEYPDGRRCPWLASQTDIMSDDWHHF